MVIALLGYGTVGGGVCEILKGRDDVSVRYVLDREPHAELGEKSVTDFERILEDASVDTVVEAIGGLDPAALFVRRAMEAGKNVVTSNKELVAERYEELLALSLEKGVAFRTSAAVGGGVPWLPALERAKRVGRITEIGGIVSGTANYILDAMTRYGSDFASALREAQALGFAEADPSADVDGLDARRKCVISANVAFDACLPERQVPVFGIGSLTPGDVEGFRDEGYVLRQYMTARALDGGEFAAYVEPTLFPKESAEASVSANGNLISYVSEYAGRQSFLGEGAGRLPTAFAVVQDLLDVADRRCPFYTATARPAVVNNVLTKQKYYVRYQVDTWFMDGCVAARWGNGVITREITPAEIHYWNAEAKRNDPGIFFAAVRGDERREEARRC